jgi:2-phospho-L-lactate/phosphoenolpyruvate guanylyltransferase
MGQRRSEGMRWQAIVPIREGAGKSRLQEDLTEVFARDTLKALLSNSQIETTFVVGRRFPDLAITHVHDPDLGLNAAIARALKNTTGATLIVLGDLPALRSEDLYPILDQAAHQEAGFVSDHTGLGTTMITINTHRELPLHFGPESASKFAASGFVELRASFQARCDIDTPEDLQRAQALGLGMHTLTRLKELDSA